MDNPYEILGVSQDASQKDISIAYRALARKYHPDVSSEPEAAEKFKKIALAYETIGDEASRRKYDTRNDGVNINLSDIFGGFNFGNQFVKQGQNLQVRIILNLNEAKTGCNKLLKIKRTNTCADCQGSGAAETEKCGVCQGKGMTSQRMESFNFNTTCQACQGHGQRAVKSCDTCFGKGKVLAEPEDMEVKIPPGIKNGMKLRLAGQGGLGRKNEHPGDLYVLVAILPHEIYQVDDINLHCEVDVNYATLILGGQEKITTLEGDTVEMKIPAGTKSGTVCKLRGLGMPDVNDPKHVGDIRVQVNLKIPTNISEDHKNLLEKLAEIENGQ